MKLQPPPLVLTLAVATAYVLAAQLGFSLAFSVEQVTAVWPPTGIAVAVLCRYGARGGYGIALGAFVANVMTSAPAATALGIAAGNTAGPLLGTWLMKRFGFDARLERVRDVLLLASAGSLLAMAVSASNGVLQLYASGLIVASALPSVFLLWWCGDAMGVLLVAPLILAWASGAGRLRADLSAAEAVLFAAALAATVWLSLLSSLPLAYLVFPVVIWSALRHGQRETALTVAVIAAIAVATTVQGRGPFAVGGTDPSLILLVSFLAILSVTGLLLGAVIAERRAAQASVELARRTLEDRVAERTRALSQANRDLTATNQALTLRTVELAHKTEEVEAFVYIVSHDLRAPLVNLQSFARELELGCQGLVEVVRAASLPEAVRQRVDEVLDQDVRTALHYIAASVTKFERLIGALLALSRTGQQSYAVEMIDTGKLLAETLNTLRQSVIDSGAKVEVMPLPQIRGDLTAMGQVFGNLLSNALKYRDPRRPLEIRISGARHGHFAEIRVADTGAGIPAEALRRLFQVFQRFHPDLAPGDGIGLASVKRIVERHGGTIRAESEVGRGSVFIFTLPSPQAGSLT